MLWNVEPRLLSMMPESLIYLSSKSRRMKVSLYGADKQMDPAELIDDDLDNSTALKLRRKLWLSQNQQQSTHPPSEE